MCLLASFAGIFIFATNTFLATEIRQALIAGLVVVSGWLATFLMQELNRANDRKALQLDIQLALRAEIQDSYDTFTYRDLDTRAFGRAVENRILEGGDGPNSFHPFIARDANQIVFDALKERLHFLPTGVIDEVIQFYCQMADLQAFSGHMMQSDFKELEARRRAAAYGHYIQMTIECERRAQDALTQLNYSLGVYDDRGTITQAARYQAKLDISRKALRRWINKTGQDQNDQSTDEAL